MKNIFWTITIALLAIAGPARAALDFAALSGSSIEFFGSSFQFQISSSSGSSPYQWDITSPGSASGFLGEFTGGPWTYGPVDSVIPGVYETANVIGPLGGFVISDGTGDFATGNVNWAQVDTLFSSGALNAAAVVNITNLRYNGMNSALLNLVQSGDGSVNLSFQFDPSMDLLSLSSGSGPYDTSYSGSFAPVPLPEPNQFGICAGILAFLPATFGVLRRRLSRREL